MRKHAKAPHIQKRQSDLLMTFASNEHKAIARLIQAWLSEQRNKPYQTITFKHFRFSHQFDIIESEGI
jgi:hypothetical protein